MNLGAPYDQWFGFEATYIFPLAYDSQWNMENYDQWITIDPPQGGKINSVQNGILLLAHLHKEWDAYRFSINPDVSYFLCFMMVPRFPLFCPSGQESRLETRFNKHFQNGYKIVYFGFDINQQAGKTLDNLLLSDPHRPVDQLLRWHFRQAVLFNMRGAGEPVFEDDFPPGSDMMGQILAGPKAAQRMEFELFDRLAHHVDLV